jgi:hypothetical protein
MAWPRCTHDSQHILAKKWGQQNTWLDEWIKIGFESVCLTTHDKRRLASQTRTEQVMIANNEQQILRKRPAS